MRARRIAQKTQTEWLLEYTAIVAREPDEKAMTEMIILACVTGSVLISKTNFMSKPAGRRKEEGRKGSKGSVGYNARVRGRQQGQ